MALVSILTTILTQKISQNGQTVTDEYPTFNIVGEVWMQNSSQMAHWQKTVQ
jgi:hypothetical protein